MTLRAHTHQHTPTRTYARARTTALLQVSKAKPGGARGRGSTYGGSKNSGNDQLPLQGGLDVVDASGRLQVCGDEGSEQAHQDPNSGDEQGVAHGHVHVLGAQSGDGGNDESCTGGLRKGSEQVSTHSGDVSDIVSNVVCR